MGEISAQVQRYVAGAVDFGELQDFLIGFTFLDPWRGHDLPGDLDARNAYQEEHEPDPEGTLMELSRAVPDLGLTWADYQRLRSALSEQAWGNGS